MTFEDVEKDCSLLDDFLGELNDLHALILTIGTLGIAAVPKSIALFDSRGWSGGVVIEL